MTTDTKLCPRPGDTPPPSNPISFSAADNRRGVPQRSDPAKTPLVVFLDDEEEILAALRRLLANEPYELLTTESPRQALQWIREKDVHLMVSDQVMPEMFGTNFLKQVRACSPETVCAILTAYPEGGQLLQGLDQGDFSMITKPWDGEELKANLRTLLSRSRAGSGPTR